MVTNEKNMYSTLKIKKISGRKFEFLFFIGVLLTIILQIPSFSTNIFLNISMYSFWIITIIIGVSYYLEKISYTLILILFSLLPIILYSLITNYIFQKEVFFLKELFFVIIMILMGYILSKIKKFDIKNLMILYVFTVLFVVGDAYINYLKGHLLDSTTYLYPFKNSLGVILVNSIFFLYLFNFKSKYVTYFLKVIGIFYLIMLFSLQNRTGILALVVGALAIFIFRKKSINQISSLVIIIAIITFNFFYGNDEGFINKIISKGLMLETLETQGVSGWSSRRITMIDYGMKLFSENILFGSKLALSKGVYIESFYVQLLSSYGLIGFFSIIIFFVILMILLLKITIANREDKLIQLSLAMFFGMLSIAFFEQAAPLAPGGVYFINWIIIGYTIGFYKINERKLGDVKNK